MTFQQQIQQGIPNQLPQPKPYETNINHAPKRKEILGKKKKISIEECFTLFRTSVSCRIIAGI
jgi:urocanate hydratase